MLPVMESNDYRLERWLAILLSLLFFLPFVARADDIAFTGSFHGEDMPYADGEKTFTLGGAEYEVSYRCGETECALVLASGEISQDLVTIEIVREGREVNTLDVVHVIHFAGDVDHDGRLDLIADLSRHWNESRPTLWLSSAAKDGQLVGMTAELSTTGC